MKYPDMWVAENKIKRMCKVQNRHTANNARRMVQGRALKAMQLMDARHATIDMFNESFLPASSARQLVLLFS